MPLIFLLLIGGGAFFYFFLLEDTQWPKAKTALEAIDNFNKAIKSRDLKHAAKYCSPAFAELLRKGDEAARKLGTAVDNLRSRMSSDGVSTTEMEYILALHDPFMTTFTLTKVSEQETQVTASVKNPMPTPPTESKETWTRPVFQLAYYRAFLNPKVPSVSVRVIKQTDGWLIEVPFDKDTAASVEALVKKYRDYQNAFEVLSREIKIDRTVKEDVRKRLKELTDQAARAEQ